MYLTRVKLNLNKRKTLLAIYSPAKFHGAIESSFENKQDRNLWRIDKLGETTYLLLLSSEVPNMHSFIEQFGFDNDSAETKDYSKLTNTIKEGSVLRFRLVGNPTHSIKMDGQRGKVVAHVTDEYKYLWLEKKALSCGFQINRNQCSILASEWKDFYKGNPEKKSISNRVHLLQVSYEGTLTVTNVDAFINAINNGIGRGKAYGCGLLTVAKI